MDGIFFPADTTSQQFTLMLDLMNDSVVENTEHLFLSLSSSDPAVLVNSQMDQINLTIIDNDGIVPISKLCNIHPIIF